MTTWRERMSAPPRFYEPVYYNCKKKKWPGRPETTLRVRWMDGPTLPPEMQIGDFWDPADPPPSPTYWGRLRARCGRCIRGAFARLSLVYADNNREGWKP